MKVIGLKPETIFEFKKESFLRLFGMLLIVNIFCLFYNVFLGNEVKDTLVFLTPLNAIVLIWASFAQYVLMARIDHENRIVYFKYFKFFTGTGEKSISFDQLSFSLTNEKMDRFSRGDVLRIKKGKNKVIEIKENSNYWCKKLLDDLFNELKKVKTND